MVSVKFNFNGKVTKIQCDLNDKIRDIIQTFAKNNRVDLNELIFLYNGQVIDPNKKFNEIANNENEIEILVGETETDTENKKKEKDTIIHSKEIICPECGEICLISFEDFKITLSKCKNKHEIKNILLDEFKNTQNINESRIKCSNYNNCENNKHNVFDNQFYLCLQCNKKLCPLCKGNHINSNGNHNVIDYDTKNYICNEHNEKFISYCEECNLNLCLDCSIKHNKEHKIIKYQDIIEDEKKIKEKLKKFKEKRIDIMIDKINKITSILNKVVENINKYYNIMQDIMNNFNPKNKNYEIFNNLKEIKNNLDIKEIDHIIYEDDIINIIKNILIIYNKMKSKNTTLTRIPPKECKMHEEMTKLNKEFNDIEKELNEKTKKMRKEIKEMEDKLKNLDEKDKSKIAIPGGKYIGQAEGNLISGLGTEYSEEDIIYEGEFKENKRNGIGKEYCYDSVYLGQFENGIKKGFGINEGLNRNFIIDKYIGEWNDDDINGKGMFIYENGDIYIGDLVKGLPNGFGKMFWTSGDYFIGNYIDGENIEGKFFYSEENGIFDVKFETINENKTIGTGTFYNLDGDEEKRKRIIDSSGSKWEIY